MPTIDVVDLNNKVVGSMELADEVFAVEVNEALLHESVRHYRAGLRAGTHKTKTRDEVSGSGKKLWRQKGTGRARMGSIRSPIWRHGGIVHGPEPRDYSFKLNRKMAQGALRSALTAKLQDGAVKVVEALALDSHKTRDFDAALGRLEADGKVLVVDNSEDRNLLLASRNLAGVTVVRSREVHPYHLLDSQWIVMSRQSAERLNETLAAGPGRAQAAEPAAATSSKEAQA